MSKAALHFDLSDEDDRRQFHLAAEIVANGWTSAAEVRHASDMYGLIHDIDQMLRSKEKYDEHVTAQELELIDRVRQLIADSGFHGWLE